MVSKAALALAALLALPLAAAAQDKDKPAPQMQGEEAKKDEAAKPRVAMSAPRNWDNFDFSRCVVKPVMSDEDLRRCGATPTQPKY